MSTALAVCHGSFGRVTVYRLDKPMRTHAHREGHLTFHLGGPPAIVTISDIPHLVDQSVGVVDQSLAAALFSALSRRQALGLSGRLYLRTLARPRPGGPRQPALRRQRHQIRNDDPIDRVQPRRRAGQRRELIAIVDRGLNQLFDASFDDSWMSGGRPGDGARPREPVLDFRVRKSLRLLNDGLAQGIELESVARDAGLSRPHFFKLFRENTGPDAGALCQHHADRAGARSHDGLAGLDHRHRLRTRLFLAKPFHPFLLRACRHRADAISHHRARGERVRPAGEREARR